MAFLGFLHGLEPDHGWPLATLYSLRGPSMIMGVVVSVFLSAMHLAPALLVFLAYSLIHPLVSDAQPVLRYLGAGVLLLLAVKYWVEKPKPVRGLVGGGGPGQVAIMDIRHISLVAFLLGFIHHEPYILIALMISGANPLPMIIIYLLSVMLGMMTATLLSLRIITIPKIYSWITERADVLPKLGAVILALMALSLFLL